MRIRGQDDNCRGSAWIILHILEEHNGIFPVLIDRPDIQTFPVGVSGLDEVSPVAVHGIAHGLVTALEGTTPGHTIDIWHFGGMVGAAEQAPGQRAGAEHRNRDGAGAPGQVRTCCGGRAPSTAPFTLPCFTLASTMGLGALLLTAAKIAFQQDFDMADSAKRLSKSL